MELEEQNIKQHVEEQPEEQQHVLDENDGRESNHLHPKLDLKNFHTQLW